MVALSDQKKDISPTSKPQGKKMKQQTYMARLILKMQQCLEELGVDTSTNICLERMERMAILIHESMSLSSRNYHSVQHVFDITQNLHDPVCILAALFHDCVYYHVDGGLSDRQQAILKGDVVAVVEKSPKMGYCQLQPGYKKDELLHLVVMIFGIDTLEDRRLTPTNGVNEFLSAVIAVRELEPLLSPPHLAEIACCIEATIPFRPTTEATGTPMDRLFLRMQKTGKAMPYLFGTGLSTDDQLVLAVQRAVMLTNEDVGNFSTDDPGCFLDNTWNLLPESNEALRHEYLYTVREFTNAVHKMYGFFAHFLKPGLIFQQFRGVPTNEELLKRIDNADRNVQVGRKYLSAKLLSLSMLSAFAELSGGDAPIAMFMGDLPSRNRWSRRLEDALNLPQYSDGDGGVGGSSNDEDSVPRHCDVDVYRLLSHGRKSDTSFDIRQSPLAAYLYASLGDEGVERLVRDNLQTFPLSKEGASALLQRLPRSLMTHVAENVAKIAQSRSTRILQILRDMPPE
jgi:hypothetical protein